MLQNSCGDNYDLCMESMAARVGEFEQAIVNNQGSFPDGKDAWFGKDSMAKVLDWSTNLDAFACTCAIMWKPAFSEARGEDKVFCCQRALTLFNEVKGVMGAKLIGLIKGDACSPAVVATATHASFCFSLPVSPAIVGGIYAGVRTMVPGAGDCIDAVYNSIRVPVDRATRYYIGASASGEKLMADKGCGEGDVRDQCEDTANASRTDSLVGAGRLATWTGSTVKLIDTSLLHHACSTLRSMVPFMGHAGTER